MCIFKIPKPQPQELPQMAPAKSRDNASLESNPLPSSKDVTDPDEVGDVQYGSERKKQGPGAGQKPGARALQIPLNVPTGDGGQGGIST